MRYVMIGAGAVGGTVGARLHEAGRDVTLVARGEHLAAIRERGLQVDEPDRSRVVALPAVADVDAVDWRPGDVAVLSTKTQDSEALLDALRACAPDVAVVCMQNGVANERFAAERFADVRGVCVMMPAEHLEPGQVRNHSFPVPGLLDIGRYPLGVDALTETIAADLSAAGFSSRPDPAIMRWKYHKLLGNLGNAAEAVCGGDDPQLLALYTAVRAEGERCLDAVGIAHVTAEEERTRRGDLFSDVPVGGRARGGGSTWQSLRRGTGSVEAAFLNGEIVALGQAHGVPTPVNALVLTVATEMARSRAMPGGHRAADLLAEAGADART